MSVIPELARQAIEHARAGRLSDALSLAKRALADRPVDQALTFFVGVLHARRMEFGEAAKFLREARRLAPNDRLATIELARVLIGLNQLDEAGAALAHLPPSHGDARRLRGLILMRRERHAEAAALFEQIVAGDPKDFESWGNLGTALLADGQAIKAVESFETSLRLRRDQQRFRDKWAEARFEAGLGEAGLALARDFADANPSDVFVRVTIARLEDLLGRPDLALAALTDALALDSTHAPALLALADLQERQSDLAALRTTIVRLDALADAPPELPLFKARLALRDGDPATALALVEAAPVGADPGTRAQLLGQIHDRLGNSKRAFAAFAEMNRHNGLGLATVEARARAFRSSIEKRSRLVSRKFVRGWPSEAALDRSNPIFVIGFPRSGTTLLDTFLMGHPRLCVAEEKPMLDKIASTLGGYEQLPHLDEQRLEELRALYFAEAARHVPDLGDRILIDKQPFAMIDVPLVYRLFPQARFVFVQRHPCDAVLSCFITRFEPNNALANFTTLDGAAHMYDEMMRLWARSRAVLPMVMHIVRYERLVDEAEAEMKALFNFLGLDWHRELLAHEATAGKRGFISTPSYAQVAEPLNDRSIGRWERYRPYMAPILPRLRVWAEVMGYDL